MFEIKIPTVGESITEAVIGSWLKKSGDLVNMNDVLLTVETDKASVEVVAEKSGKLEILVEAGKTVPIGSLVGKIDTSVAVAAKPAAEPAKAAEPQPAAAPNASAGTGGKNLDLSPAVQRMVSEHGLNPQNISASGPGGRITTEDVVSHMKQVPAAKAPAAPAAIAPAVTPTAVQTPGQSRRVPMTTIRKRIAERLVFSQQSTATLTTFNEIDMSAVMALRAQYKEPFKEKYGVNLGFMGLFVKASIEALKAFPAVNAFIDGQDLVYNDFFNIGIAVGTEKGLIVPVIKGSENLSVAKIEMTIRDFAKKARDGKITVDDLSGGTFTITNGGVYGSLLSTPILNPPQSGILGLHKIEERPVVIQGKVEARPMMYVALSYDHRVIDGKEAVSFLVKIKEGMEDPSRLLLEI